MRPLPKRLSLSTHTRVRIVNPISIHEESLNLGASVIRPEVEVQTVLRRLLFRDTSEQKTRKAICSGTDLELLRILIDHYPSERSPPPDAERHR